MLNSQIHVSAGMIWNLFDDNNMQFTRQVKPNEWSDRHKPSFFYAIVREVTRYTRWITRNQFIMHKKKIEKYSRASLIGSIGQTKCENYYFQKQLLSKFLTAI